MAAFVRSAVRIIRATRVIPAQAGIENSLALVREAQSKDLPDARASVRGGAWHVLRISLGALLLTSALLKTHELATAPLVVTGLPASRWFLLAVVQTELLIGVLLIAGLWPAYAWRTALALFGAFGVVSLSKALAGAASCGCFGRVAVSPWFSAAVDVGALAALVAFRPHPSFRRVSWRAAALPVIAWLLLGATTSAAVVTYRPSTLDGSGEITGVAHIVLLEPETWVGERLPLLRHIDVGAQLEQGDWLVVVYRQNCPKCHVLFGRLKDAQSNTDEASSAPQLACVEIPGGSSSPAANDAKLPDCLHGKLAAEYDWFVETPVLIRLHNSRVESASVGGNVSMAVLTDSRAVPENTR
jgi:hypothetical protein